MCVCKPTCLHQIDQIVGCHLFRYRKLYDLYCIFSTSRLKQKKTKQKTKQKQKQTNDPPNCRPKGQTNLFRPYANIKTQVIAHKTCAQFA